MLACISEVVIVLKFLVASLRELLIFDFFKVNHAESRGLEGRRVEEGACSSTNAVGILGQLEGKFRVGRVGTYMSRMPRPAEFDELGLFAISLEPLRQ